MEKRQKYGAFWNRKLKWSLKDEFYTYMIVCEEFKGINKWIYLRKKNVVQLNSFEEWESHVKSNIADLDEKEKREFSKYLRNLKRKASIGNKMSIGYLLPAAVAILSYFFTEYIEGVGNMPTQQNKFLTSQTLVFLILYFGVWMIMALIMIYVVTKKVNCELISSEMKYIFYKDYIEVVKKQYRLS